MKCFTHATHYPTPPGGRIVYRVATHTLHNRRTVYSLTFGYTYNLSTFQLSFLQNFDGLNMMPMTRVQACTENAPNILSPNSPNLATWDTTD